MTTDQGYIREVSAVSEPLQSLPPTTYLLVHLLLQFEIVSKKRVAVVVAPLLKPPPLTSCHPSWALVELTKSMQEQWSREVILHEKFMKD